MSDFHHGNWRYRPRRFLLAAKATTLHTPSGIDNLRAVCGRELVREAWLSPADCLQGAVCLACLDRDWAHVAAEILHGRPGWKFER